MVVVIDIEFRASWGGDVAGNAHVDESASADRTSAAPDWVGIVIVKNPCKQTICHDRGRVQINGRIATDYTARTV